MLCKQTQIFSLDPQNKGFHFFPFRNTGSRLSDDAIGGEKQAKKQFQRIMCFKFGDFAVIPLQRCPTLVFRSRMKHNATGSVVWRVAYCIALWAARIYLRKWWSPSFQADSPLQRGSARPTPLYPPTTEAATSSSVASGRSDTEETILRQTWVICEGLWLRGRGGL